MLVKDIVVGMLQVNCYIIADDSSGKAMVIDPGDEPDRIMDIIKGNNLSVEHIICTHGHFDHVGAISELRSGAGTKFAIHKDELAIYAAARDMAAFWGYEIGALPEPDMLLKGGEKIRIGNLAFEVFHTPGHSPGGICLYGDGVVVTGDTLFAGSVGRTDFTGGDMGKLKKSFRQLMELPEGTKVLPGHGPQSTIGREKKGNMFSEEFLK